MVAGVQPVFVGDVQGCGEELEEILARARDRHGDDFELWVVGDLINRGPANLRALSRVRELVERGRAQYVLGNHEIGFMASALGLRPIKYTDTLGELLDRPDCDDWIEWLRRRPLCARGALGDTPFVMVHAAVHPDWDVGEVEARARAVERRLGHEDRGELLCLLGASPEDDVDRDALGLLTSCRSVTPDGAWSKLEPVASAVPWHAAWSSRGHGYGVVYGHWSLQGLHVAPGLRGLDTGCVHHGRDHEGFLTAWVPDPGAANPFGLPDERFWQVRARARYYRDPPATML